MGMSLERLPECSVHGSMELVAPGTNEQKWCGVWYRCTRCTSSVLLPSPKLTTHLGVAALSTNEGGR